MGFAPIAQSHFEGLDISALEWEPPGDAEAATEEDALVLVQSQFVALEPGFVARLGGKGASPFFKVPTDELQTALNQEAEARVRRTLGAPWLVSRSAQSSHTLVVRQAAYIRDCTPKPSSAGETTLDLQPEVGVCNTGYVVAMRPAFRDNKIEIRDLTAQTGELLGERLCRGSIRSLETDQEAVWTEPVLLMGKLAPNLPEILEIAKGESLVLPFQYEIRQGTASARGYCVPESLREEYSSSGTPEEGYESPLNLECVLLLEAKRITKKEYEAMMEESKKAFAEDATSKG